MWFNTGAASFIISLGLAEIDMGKKRPWLTISNADLRPALLGKLIVNRPRVSFLSNSKLHFVSVMFIHIGRSESQVLKFFIATRLAHSLEIPIVVMVDEWRLEPLFSMIYIICTSRYTVIEFIDIKCIEVLGNMYHFGLFLVTKF